MHQKLLFLNGNVIFTKFSTLTVPEVFKINVCCIIWRKFLQNDHICVSVFLPSVKTSKTTRCVMYLLQARSVLMRPLVTFCPPQAFPQHNYMLCILQSGGCIQSNHAWVKLKLEMIMGRKLKLKTITWRHHNQVVNSTMQFTKPIFTCKRYDSIKISYVGFLASPYNYVICCHVFLVTCLDNELRSYM